MNISKATVAVMVVLCLSGLCLAQELIEGIDAITRPSSDKTLSFIRPGLVKNVLVKEGDMVKADQVLVRMDDSVEQAELAHLKAQSEDKVRIQAAKANLDQKKVDLEKTKWAAERNVATDLQVRHATLDVTIADLSLALRTFESAQDTRKYNEAKVRLSRMQLSTPVAGKVEKIHIEAGESVNAVQEVIRVVNIDSLKIDVPVPLEQARRLRVGQLTRIIFPGSHESLARTAEGKVGYIASIADAASNTLMVCVEVDNPTGRPAGEHIQVRFLPSRAKTSIDKKVDKVDKEPESTPKKENTAKDAVEVESILEAG